MEVIEKYEHAGCSIEFVVDIDPPDPREWDNLGIMVCGHRRYKLGDEQTTELFTDEVEKRWRDGGLYFLPLYLYEHGGITMYVGSTYSAGNYSSWDESLVGFIYTTQERIDELGLQHQDQHDIETYLRDEVKEYAAYLEGDCYGWIVSRDDVVIESLWGILNYHNTIESSRADANAVAEHEESNVAKLGFYEMEV